MCLVSVRPTWQCQLVLLLAVRLRFECAVCVVTCFPSSARGGLLYSLLFSLDNLGPLLLLLVGGLPCAVTWRSALSMFERTLFVVMFLDSQLSCPIFFFFFLFVVLLILSPSPVRWLGLCH